MEERKGHSGDQERAGTGERTQWRGCSCRQASLNCTLCFCPISKPHPPLSPTANEQVEKQLTPWPQQTLPSSESSMAKVTQASEELQWDCGGARVECLVCPYYRDWAALSVHLAWPPGSLKNRGEWANNMAVYYARFFKDRSQNLPYVLFSSQPSCIPNNN